MAAMRAMALLMTAVAEEARAKAAAMAVVRAAALTTMALRVMLVVPAEVRPTVVAIVAVRAMTLTTMAAVAEAVATTTAAVTLAVAAVMVTAETRATAMAVMLLVASGSGNGGNGTTMDVCYAILLRYSGVVDVRSNNNGECAPAFNGSNIVGGLPTLTMACGVRTGVSNNSRERAAIPVAAVVAEAGRGGLEAPAGGNNV